MNQIMSLRIFLFFLIVLSSCTKETIPLKSDDSDIDKLLEIADDFEGMNFDSSLYYSEKALHLSKKSGTVDDIIRSLNNVGFSLNELGRSEESLQYHMEAYELAQKNNDIKNEAKTLNFIGVYYDRFSDYGTSQKYFLESLKLREVLNDTLGKAIVLGNLGLNYFRLEEFELAEKYLLEVVEIDELLKDTFYMSASYLNLALVYDKTDRNEEAIEANLKSIECSEVSGNKNDLALAMNNLGDIYGKMGNYEQGEQLILDALAIRRSIRSDYNIMWSHIILSKLYNKWEKYNKALMHSDSALYYNNSIQNKRAQSSILNNRKEIFQSISDYESALYTQEELTAVKDSMYKEQKENNLAATEARLNLLEKENQINTLSIEKLKSEKKILRLTIWLISILVFSTGLYFFYRNKLKKVNKEYAAIYMDLQRALTEISVLQTEIDKKRNDESNILDKYDLTFREIEVIELVSQGMTNKEVSNKLYISENTVKYHVKNIYTKLGIKDRNELRRMAS